MFVKRPSISGLGCFPVGRELLCREGSYPLSASLSAEMIKYHETMKSTTADYLGRGEGDGDRLQHPPFPPVLFPGEEEVKNV